MKPIGIDAIALAVPEGYVDLEDLANARNIPPGKFIDGLGVRRMAVARSQRKCPTASRAAPASRRMESWSATF